MSRYEAGALQRFFKPRTVAIVGATDSQPRTHSALEAMKNTAIDVFLVNPNRSTVANRPTVPNLASIPAPVDAVFSLVGPRASVEIVREARAARAGGVVVNAGGFAEAGSEGVLLQQALQKAAGDMPLLGPNCNGFLDLASGATVSGRPLLPCHAGTVGFVTQSGAMIGAMGLAGVQRGFGFSSMISTGNECCIDIADCLEFLADDEETQAICLVVESVRRPQAFFEAVAHALAVGKPVLALKLGRSQRGREIASSHTGALVGDAWAYESAFRQHGILLAQDLADLADRAMFFGQLPASRWTAADRVSIISLSGGSATLAGDICADEGLMLPRLNGLQSDLSTLIPGIATPNPIDLTGLVMGRPDLANAALSAIARCDEVDALVVQWFLEEEAYKPGATLIEAARNAGEASGKLVVIAALEDGALGDWARKLPATGVAAGRGMRATVRALQALQGFSKNRSQSRARKSGAPASRLERPAQVVNSSAGPMLSFGDSMALLASVGIPTASHVLIGPDDSVSVPRQLGTAFVVKLADVPHRTDIDGVALSVRPEELPATVERLRSLANSLAVPASIVVQPMIDFDGEAFIGVKGSADLGPMVVFGLGGIFVEVLKKVSGRLAPLARDDALAILSDFDDSHVFAGFRGRRPWPKNDLAEILLKVSDLALRSESWLSSLDINPLLYGPAGFVAVDALFLTHPTTKGLP